MEETKNKMKKSNSYPSSSRRTGKKYEKNTVQKNEISQKNTENQYRMGENAHKSDRSFKSSRKAGSRKPHSNDMIVKDVDFIMEKGQNEKKKSKKSGKNTVLETEPYRVARNAPALRVVSLGGLGEIGKNITAIECGEDIIVIDCGVAFPDDDMLGVDLVIPDVTYLSDHIDRVRGILLTFERLIKPHIMVISPIGSRVSRSRIFASFTRNFTRWLEKSSPQTAVKRCDRRDSLKNT